MANTSVDKLTVRDEKGNSYALDISIKVSGPASTTNNAVAIFDGTGGKSIKNSGFTIGKSVPSDAKFTDTTYSNATTSAAGLMSSTDKTKLNGIETGAQVNPGNATTSAAGLMSADDKTKLEGIEAGAQVNPGNATTSAAGLMSADDKTKLNGIATGATANVGTITGITMNGASKGSSGVVNLGTVITAHQDISGKVTGPASATNNAVAIFDGTGGKTIKNSGFTIGKSVPSDAKFTDTTYSNATTSAAGLMSSDDKTKLDGIAAGATANVGTITGIKMNGSSKGSSGVVDLGTVITAHQDISGKLNSSLKGAANGLAELDANGKVPSSQLPSYVDDVLEYASSSNFPETGETGKIYIAKDTNKTYRWSGTAYVEISASIALGETSSTAYRGDRGKTAYTHASAKGSAFASGLYKITTNAEGHVTDATAVEKADITGLGIPAQDTTYSNATTSAAGLMSSDDKTKLNGIATGATANVGTITGIKMNGSSKGSSGVVDLGTVITAHQDISGKVTGPASATNNAVAIFDGTGGKTIKNSGFTIGKSVPSDAKFTDTTYSNATTSAAGLMSSDDKTKLDGIATGATANVGTITGITMNGASKGSSGVVNLGTVITAHQDISGKVTGPASATGNNIAVFDGTTGKLIKDSGFTIGKSVPSDAKFTDTTYAAATTSAAGLMSISDKTKLDGLDASLYAPKATPHFTGSISLGRKNNLSSTNNSIAVGTDVKASGENSNAFGNQTEATGACAHAEGALSVASGASSHAEGVYTNATGTYSHTEGLYTTAKFRSQHVFGEYNKLDPSTQTSADVRGTYAEIVGNGTDDTTNNRSNARTLDWSGNERLKGDIYVGCNADSTGGSKLIPIPEAAAANNGKVLKITNGAWAIGEVEALPAVTSTDNGKVLRVVNGIWAAATIASANGVSF